MTGMPRLIIGILRSNCTPQFMTAIARCWTWEMCSDSILSLYGMDLLIQNTFQNTFPMASSERWWS